MQKTEGASERRYLGYHKKSIASQFKNGIVLMPKMVGIERLVGQTGGTCVPNVFGVFVDA